MDLLTHIPVTAVGVLTAMVSVVAGAPLFAMGRRARRMRRCWRAAAWRS
jgi:hypothetical protein